VKVEKQEQKSEHYKRNPSLSWGLKQKYKDRCQVCQEKLVVGKGFFCDTHHIVPLKSGGSDNSDNIAVVCPNHHSS
jgi:predicted restriction endonuclease